MSTVVAANLKSKRAFTFCHIIMMFHCIKFFYLIIAHFPQFVNPRKNRADLCFDKN